MSASRVREQGGTFRSGPYLDTLFRAQERMDTHLQRQICERIKQARTEAGLTQTEMADLLGVTLRGYQNYEAERVPFRKLTQIARITNVTEEWMLRGDAAAVPPPLELLQEVGEGVRALASSQVVGHERLDDVLARLKRIEALLSRREAADS